MNLRLEPDEVARQTDRKFAGLNEAAAGMRLEQVAGNKVGWNIAEYIVTGI